MALTLLNASGFQAAIEVDETGVNLASYSCRYYPQFRRELLNYLGQTRGWALPTIPSGEVSMQGEVSGGTGVMAYTFLTACTIANDTALFGRSAGIFLLLEATETQDREGWRSISQSLRADPLVTSV